MSDKWTVEEDEIVCDYYFDNLGKKPDFDVLTEAINRINPKRGKDTIAMRYRNYQYLDTGFGLAHYSKQEETIYKKKKKERK